MLRRLLAVLVVGLAIAAGGYGVFRYAISQPAPVEVPPPQFTDNAGTPLPDTDEFTHLAKTDPVAMLEKCLSRYAREVTGFRATLHKRERIGGALHPPERVRVAVRNEPFAVSMVWDEGARGVIGAPVVGVLYPYADEKNPQKADPVRLAVWRPDALFSSYRGVEVKDDLARLSSRYSVKESGFDKSMLRTLDAWKTAKQKQSLRFEYLGSGPVEQLGGRVCHRIRRTCPTTEADSYALDEARPTDPKKLKADGFDQVTIFIDAERWIQVGTELKKASGDLVGEYYFRDLELNPTFAADAFTPAALKAAAKK
jgi:hypothetical protein